MVIESEYFDRRVNSRLVNGKGYLSLTELWWSLGHEKIKSPAKFISRFCLSKSDESVEYNAKGRYSGYYVSEDLSKLYINWCKNESIQEVIYAHKEHGALCAIEQLLCVKLKRQYTVLGYRIDGYCEKTNTAYEIDEPHHFIDGKLRDKDLIRQRVIEDEIGCKFVRIKV